jgi:hypothetical protein
MPTPALHAEILKPALGGSSSFLAGLLLEYLSITPPIFVAASFGAVVAVVMLHEQSPLKAILISLAGGFGACYGYSLIKPVFGLDLAQAPATALLAFVLVYFLPQILEVGKSRIEDLKK